VKVRETLLRWAEAKEALRSYWQEKNSRSIDGLPAPLIEGISLPA
jgi:hypothetical protein